MGSTRLVAARVVVVNFDNGDLLCDWCLIPSGQVTNYFTRRTGLTRDNVKARANATFRDIRVWFRDRLGPNSFIVVFNGVRDFSLLRFIPPINVINVIDLFDHPEDPNERPTLSFLVKQYLQRPSGYVAGLNPVEDAQNTCMLLAQVILRGTCIGLMLR